MKFEKIKQFISIREDLRNEGVIGLNPYWNEVHMDKAVLVTLPGLQMKDRNCDQFPYEVHAVIEGIKFFSIFSDEDLNEFPQIKELFFMQDDVDLSGGADLEEQVI